jgi:hypothetical protein
MLCNSFIIADKNAIYGKIIPAKKPSLKFPLKSKERRKNKVLQEHDRRII